MKLYYKHKAESNLGIGIVYFEFDNNYASRQVEVYGNKWFCSNNCSNTGYHHELGGLALCDQPLSELCLSPKNEISSDDFEEIWYEAFQKT